MEGANILMSDTISSKIFATIRTSDLVFCKSENQVADILTKPLKQAAFEKLRGMLGVCSSKSAVQGRVLQSC